MATADGGCYMKTVRRLLYRDIAGAVGFVTLAFLSLFFFIDFVDELQDVGKNGYGIVHALLSCALELRFRRSASNPAV